MSKELATIFIFLITISLSLFGIPTDEIEATIYLGNEILDSEAQTANSIEEKQVIANSKLGLDNLQKGLNFISFLDSLLTK